MSDTANASTVAFLRRECNASAILLEGGSKRHSQLCDASRKLYQSVLHLSDCFDRKHWLSVACLAWCLQATLVASLLVEARLFRQPLTLWSSHAVSLRLGSLSETPAPSSKYGVKIRDQQQPYNRRKTWHSENCDAQLSNAGPQLTFATRS